MTKRYQPTGIVEPARYVPRSPVLAPAEHAVFADVNGITKEALVALIEQHGASRKTLQRLLASRAAK